MRNVPGKSLNLTPTRLLPCTPDELLTSAASGLGGIALAGALQADGLLTRTQAASAA